MNELSQITDTKHATAPIVNYETQFKMIRTSTVRSGHLHTKMMDSVTYEVYEEWSERIHLKADDVVFSREAPMGESAIIPDNNNKYFLGQRMVGIRTSTSLDPVFLISTFQAPKFRKEILIRNAESTTVANFGIPSIKSYEIDLPQINEQSKISRFFKLIGIIIALHQRKLELLKKLKQGYLQKLFPQDGRKVPQLRFAQFSDDWEKRKLSEFLTPSSDRNNAGKYDQDNILAASLGTELVKKHIFFGLRSTEKSVKSYYIVYPGDVIYTKSPIKGYPNGIVRTNKGVHGIVPSLYCVYHSTHEVNPSIIQVYFEDKYRLDAYLYPLVNVGARNNVNITNSGFLEGYICVSTDIKEQNEVVDIIELVNDNIALYHQKIKFLTKLKQGYLNNLFF